MNGRVTSVGTTRTPSRTIRGTFVSSQGPGDSPGVINAKTPYGTPAVPSRVD